MPRLIVLLLLGFVIYLFVRNLKRRVSVRKKHETTRPVESMVVCAHCAVHVPETEAAVDNGRYFCSEAHRKLGRC